MLHRPDTHRRLWKRPLRGVLPTLTAAIVCVLVIAAPLRALGQDGSGGSAEPSERGPYSGAFYGPEAFVGYGWAGDGRPVGSGSFSFRHSLVFLFADSRLSYVFDDALQEDGLDRHGVWLHTCLHPTAAVIIGSDWLAYLLSSPYIELGAGGLAYVGDAAGEVASPSFGWTVGGGIDIPLANPDRGQSAWLELLYRHRRDALNRGSPAARRLSNVFYLGVGWRLNGTLF